MLACFWQRWLPALVKAIVICKNIMKTRKHQSAALVLILYWLLLAAKIVFANDSGAEMGASGLQLKKIENISMEREDLYISQKKIKVAYLFKNHSDKDITTEIAFPVPEYTTEDAQRGLPFDDFEVEVNGEKIKHNSEIKALLRGKDYSAILQKMGITIYDFGGFSEPLYKDFYQTLSEKDKKLLRSKGLVDENGYPLWKASVKYYWTQTFPANSTTEIKHAYTPWSGYFYFTTDETADKNSFLFEKACASQDIARWIRDMLAHKRNKVFVNTVAYILKTANNWQGSIRDFHLVIEKNKNEKISLCFDGKLNKISDTQFESHIKDYIPKQNLMIYYLY